MVSKIFQCRQCGSQRIKRNGHTKKGSARYQCKDCGVTRVLEPNEVYSNTQKELVLKAYQERASFRGVGRIFDISPQTVFNWVKKN